MLGEEAKLYADTCQTIRESLREQGFSEVVLPSLWEQQTFIDKAGNEIIDQLYAFRDKGDRDICLIPEATALVQESWNSWKGSMKHPAKLFYIQRCYRYEKPQAGRFREFTQAGVEILGGKDTNDLCVNSLHACLAKFDIKYDYTPSVKRGLNYYTQNGFEASVESLGAQKQIAGGGRYAEGIGWAIGVDRLMLAIQGGKK